MPKIAIVYCSPHHGNTRKLLDAIVSAHPDVTLIQAGEDAFSPEQYDVIGFASGVYAGKLHRTVRKALASADGKGRRAFVIYTCGDTQGGKYGESCMNDLRRQGFETLGYFWCVGWDSFGPLRLVGGVNKGKPDADDIAGAVKFYESLNV
jgi:hypothetical protein